jgi:DNA polymerase-3 subunit epsilon
VDVDSFLAERARRFLQAGPAHAVPLIEHVCQLPGAPALVAEQMAMALFGGRPEFAPGPDGTWRLAPKPEPAVAAPDHLDSLSYAVVDVETTGMRAGERDRITEIAVVVVQGGRREVVLDTLINPGRPIPPAICAITNITNDMVREAPVFGELADQVLAALSGRIFVAHNARVDWNFVTSELQRSRDLVLDGPRLCTVRLARRLVRGIRSCGLDSLTRWFGFENRSRHRAAGDALVTAELLHRLLELARQEGARTLQDLAAIEARRTGRRARARRLAMPTPPREDSCPEAM